MEWTLKDEREISSVARHILTLAGKHKKIAFSGEIGAGKTTLIKSICQLLGVVENVTSPTYALVNEYHIENKTLAENVQKVYHIDLYRLDHIEQALSIGIEEYLYDEHYCFVEWPELIEPLLPENIIRVHLKIIENSTRKIFIFVREGV